MIFLLVRIPANMQKRRDLFHFVKSKKYDIICLQDIHLEKKIEPYVKSEWGYQVYMSPFRSNRRGGGGGGGGNDSFK